MAYETDFWGKAKTSDWWNKDMSDAGQGLFVDPQTAINTATVPKDVLSQKYAMEEDARKARGGFMQNIMQGIGSVGHDIDGALSHIPGWGVAKDVGKTLWWPVDKAASGAYWIYSNAVSQPLSTLFLQAAKAEIAPGDKGYFGTLLSGSEWSDAYGKAEHISPGQALVNYENVASAAGEPGMFASVFASGADKLSSQEKEDVKRNSERFLYDTDFWRQKGDWKYTVGTGSLDFIFNVGADPVMLVGGAASKVTKGLRAIEIATEGAEAAPKISKAASLLGTAVAKGAHALTPAAKTQEEASQATKVNNAFDWMEGKSAAEIAQHPIWGSGRRANPAKEQLSQVLSNTSREDMPLILRFAAGDNAAAAELADKSRSTLTELGKMQDNRVLVDTAKYNSELFQGFAPAEVGVQAPYKAPIATEREALNQQAAEQIYHGLNGVRPLGSAAPAASSDIMRAQEWKAGQSDATEQQLADLQQKVPYYGQVLGQENLGKSIEEFSPGVSNIFGTVKQLYRMGPAALRDANLAATKAIVKIGSGVGDRPLRDIFNKNAQGGLVTRLLQNGIYSPAVRFVDSFGERTPEKFINHNDDDAYMRVAEMLKRVPGLGADARLDMVNEYSRAADKVSRSDVLDSIHSRITYHMTQNLHNLDSHTASLINDIRKVGFGQAMTELTGFAPTSQRFSAARQLDEQGLPTGRLVDLYEDGEHYVISPLAKTQLSMAEPLLPVNELNRILSRNSGYLRTIRKGGGSAKDAVTSISDSLNTMWKAATLLRPGYVLRAMSDDQAASAVKFGIISSMADAGQGGVNWMLNRSQQIKAIVGKGSYTSTTKPGQGIFRIEDESLVANAEKLGLPTERISISNAWPLIKKRISDERDSLKGVEGQIAKLKAKPNSDEELLNSLTDQAIDHRRVIDEHTDYANALLQEAKDSKGKRLGEGEFEHEGVKVPQAFSSEWSNPIPRDQITSGLAMETVFARGEAIDNGRLIKTGSWKSVTPNEANHMDSWLGALNKQFRQDDLYRLVAKDPTLKEAKSWLKTPAGKYHMSLLGPRARDYNGTLDAIKATLDQYLPAGTGLQTKIANGEEIMEHELRGAIAKEDFPAVHGEEVKGLTAGYSKQTASRAVDDIIAKGFQKLSTIPNDVMARQPIYLRAQEARMRDLISQEIGYRRTVGAEEHLTLDEMNKLLEKSDRLARKDISQVVYDPIRTTATEALRFVTPFLSAHIDGLQRWGGLIAERPQFVGTTAKIYNAPVAANLITDQNGQHVDENGMADGVDPATGKKIKVFVPLDGRMITLRMPGDTTNVKGIGKVPSGGTRISLSALNTILPGDPWFNPGAGPYVQIAASAIAKKVPSIGDFLQWSKVLPNGPSASWTDPLLPKYMKDAWNAFTAGDKGNDAYQKAYLAEYQRQMGDYANGGPAPDMKKVESNAKQFMFLQAFTSWASPAQVKNTPLTGSPYQFFIDQYKVMQDLDPKNAQDMFMQRYGKDYFAFTASMSKSMGIASTVSADHVATQYGDLIEKNPDLASLIVGDIYNKGEFSSSVYAKQMDQLIAGQSVREKITAQEAIANNQKDLGWQQYNRYMHMLDAAMFRSGFKSYSDPGASNFSEIKQKIIDILGDKNAAWFKDYGDVQMNKMPITIKGMEQITSDKKLMADPMRTDLKALRTYLAARSSIKDILTKRGSSKISFDLEGNPSGQNVDLGNALKDISMMLVHNDTRFGDLYHRYLVNDNLS